MDYDPFSPEVQGFKKRGPLFKNAKDIINTKIFTNPKGNLKDTWKTFKQNPLEGAQMLGEPLLGKGVRYSAVNDFILSGGKAKFDPNDTYSGSMLKPGYTNKGLGAPAALPDAPVPDAPMSMRSRSVTDKMRSARADAGKRKGYLSTLFAKETGGFGSGGTGGSASLLGG